MIRREVCDYTSVDKESFIPRTFRVKFHPTPQKSGGLMVPLLYKENKIIKSGVDDFDRICQKYRVFDGDSILKRTYPGLTEKSFSTETQHRHEDWDFHLWHEFTADTDDDIRKVIDELNGLGNIELAEPIYKIEMFQTNDPHLRDQWGLYKIEMFGAWNIEMGKPNVVVAIVDGGVYVDHPDLVKNLWKDNQGRFGYNFADNTNEFVPGNHGTHVAGIVGATNNNNLGVSGVAGGSDLSDGVRLMMCQVFSDTRIGGFHTALIYAADNGAAIAQNSWGYAAPGVYDQITLDAIDYFNTHGGGGVIKGGICVFAAGNTGKDEMIYPACYSGSVAVASTDWSDKKALSSTFGNWVDISAPGQHIFSTLFANRYGTSSGTSMACPHVSGVAALIASYAPNVFTREEIIGILTSTTDDHYPNNQTFGGKLGSGRLNAQSALLKAKKMLGLEDTPTPTETPSPTATPTHTPPHPTVTPLPPATATPTVTAIPPTKEPIDDDNYIEDPIDDTMKDKKWSPEKIGTIAAIVVIGLITLLAVLIRIF